MSGTRVLCLDGTRRLCEDGKFRKICPEVCALPTGGDELGPPAGTAATYQVWIPTSWVNGNRTYYDFGGTHFDLNPFPFVGSDASGVTYTVTWDPVLGLWKSGAYPLAAAQFPSPADGPPIKHPWIGAGDLGDNYRIILARCFPANIGNIPGPFGTSGADAAGSCKWVVRIGLEWEDEPDGGSPGPYDTISPPWYLDGAGGPTGTYTPASTGTWVNGTWDSVPDSAVVS